MCDDRCLFLAETVIIDAKPQHATVLWKSLSHDARDVDALTTNPGTVTSLSIPFLVAAIGALIFIPGDNLVEAILRYGVAGFLGTGFLVFFAGGFVLASLQAEEE